MCVGGEGELNESVKKELWRKSFLLIIWNEALKICEKWYLSPNVKANKNNKKWKIWWLYLTNFYKTYIPSKLELQVLIMWKIKRKYPLLMLTTYFDHSLTLLSLNTVLSSLPCLSSMVSQLRTCRLSEQAVKIFQIRDIAWFSKYYFCDIKITNGKAIQNI